jgi:hypothetical protein
MAMIHVARGANTLGTFSEEEVRHGLRSGRFMGSDLGWREGMGSWQPLSQFPEFASEAGAEPGAAPPPPPPPPVTSTITSAPGGPTLAMPPAARAGLPWDERRQKGLFNAFIETLQIVLSRPTAAFTAMKREGGLGEPLLYAIIGGTFGTAFDLVYRFFLRSFVFFPGTHGHLEQFFSGFGLLLVLIFAPLLVLIWIFIVSAILHVCLMLVGGAQQSFETTFRVICFTLGSAYPLLVIPVCGQAIAFVWSIVLYIIGFARAHETDTGRATLAVFLPLIVCCGGFILLLVMVGGIGALMQHMSG